MTIDLPSTIWLRFGAVYAVSMLLATALTTLVGLGPAKLLAVPMMAAAYDGGGCIARLPGPPPTPWQSRTIALVYSVLGFFCSAPIVLLGVREGVFSHMPVGAVALLAVAVWGLMWVVARLFMELGAFGARRKRGET